MQPSCFSLTYNKYNSPAASTLLKAMQPSCLVLLQQIILPCHLQHTLSHTAEILAYLLHMSQIAASTLQRHMVPPWFYSLIADVIALLLSMQLSCFWITCHKCYSLATFRPRQLNCLRLTCHRDRGLHASTLLWLCSWATSTYFPNFVVHFGTHVQWTFTITSTTSPLGATVYYAWRTIHYCCLYLKDAAA